MELVRHSSVWKGAQIETKPHGISICFVSASTLGVLGNQSCLFVGSLAAQLLSVLSLYLFLFRHF